MASATTDSILGRFRAVGALLEGHFRLTSGLHSPGYLQCALVLQHPSDAEALARALAAHVSALSPTVVLSPALGEDRAHAKGTPHLMADDDAAERQDGKLTLRRGFSLDPGDRVLVVEDVVTTGGSTRETIEVAVAAGATVVGAASIVDRSGATAALGVPYH